MDTIFPSYPQATQAGSSRALVFLCLTSLLERIGYYSSRMAQVLLMTSLLAMSPPEASIIYSLKISLEYMVQACSAYISDRMYAWTGMSDAGLWLEAAGSLMLMLCTVLPANAGTDLLRTVFLAGLALSVTGSALFKPNLVALTALTATEKKRAPLKRLTWLYAAANGGALIGIMLVSISQAARSEPNNFFLPLTISFIATTAAALLFRLQKNRALGHVQYRQWQQNDDEEQPPYLPAEQSKWKALQPAGILLVVVSLLLYLPTNAIPNKIPFVLFLPLIFPLMQLAARGTGHEDRQRIWRLLSLMVIAFLYWIIVEYSNSFYPYSVTPAAMQAAGTVVAAVLCIVAASAFSGKIALRPFAMIGTGFLLQAIIYCIVFAMLPLSGQPGYHMLLITMLIGSLAEVLFSPVMLYIAYRIGPERYPASSMFYSTLGTGCAGSVAYFLPSLSQGDTMPVLFGYRPHAPGELALICGVVIAGISLLVWLTGSRLKKWM